MLPCGAPSKSVHCRYMYIHCMYVHVYMYMFNEIAYLLVDLGGKEFGVLISPLDCRDSYRHTYTHTRGKVCRATSKW